MRPVCCRGDRKRSARVGDSSESRRRRRPSRRACEFAARKLVEIGLPAAALVADEGSGVCRHRAREIASRTSSPTSNAVWLDRGTEPSNAAARRDRQRFDRFVEHAARKPAPTRMSRTDTRAIAIAEQHGQTVGRQDRRRPDSQLARPLHRQSAAIDRTLSRPQPSCRAPGSSHTARPED